MVDQQYPFVINIATPYQISITNEDELHKKVVHFLRQFYPQAIIVSGCVDQATDKLRIESNLKGYEAGQPDLLILNGNGTYSGFAIELKTPTGTGKVSSKQSKFMEKLNNNMWQCLISNNYDEIVMGIVRYFDDMPTKSDDDDASCIDTMDTDSPTGSHSSDVAKKIFKIIKN